MKNDFTTTPFGTNGAFASQTIPCVSSQTGGLPLSSNAETDSFDAFTFVEEWDKPKKKHKKRKKQDKACRKCIAGKKHKTTKRCKKCRFNRRGSFFESLFKALSNVFDFVNKGASCVANILALKRQSTLSLPYRDDTCIEIDVSDDKVK